MRALIRLVALTLAGAVLYYAGLVNAMVIQRPSPVGALLVVGGIAVSMVMLVAISTCVASSANDPRAVLRNLM